MPWLANSQFFVVSLFVHLLIVIWLGGTVLYQARVEPPDFTGDPNEGFVSNATTETPPVQQPQTPSFEVTAPSNAATAPALSALTSTSATQPSFALPSIVT